MVVPTQKYIHEVEQYLGSLDKPSLRFFLSSLIDQEKEHIKDIEETFNSEDFLENQDVEYEEKCKKILSSMTGQSLDFSDTITFMRDIINRKKHASKLFSYLSSQISSQAVSSSFTALASEEERHVNLLEDRLTLEELSSG